MKKSAVAIAVFVVLTSAWEAQAAAPSDALLACGEVTDSQARLQCFDRELQKARPAAATPPAAPMKAAPAPAPAAAAAPAAVAPVAAASATGSNSFGDEQVASKDPKRTEDPAMHARLSSQKEIGSSRTYNIFLDNGQVWRHEDSHLGSYLREGEAITITKGSGLGGYRLTRDAGATKDWIRVTRVR